MMKIPVRVLILPKFEIGEMTGDAAGEAQLFYEHYLAGGEEYTVPGSFPGNKLYVKDGIALMVTGVGKVNAGMSLCAVLLDPRFDFGNAYILSTGCAGGSAGNTVPGDVCLLTAAADYELGHKADPREMEHPENPTWFHDAAYDETAYYRMNDSLMDRVYALIRDIPVRTTEATVRFMAGTFRDEAWAVRKPAVLKGLTISGDNFWHGIYDHANAVRIGETYQAPDPYVATEMEDVAIANAADRFGMLDRLIIVRDIVNMDVFMNGATPETLWGGIGGHESLITEEGPEAMDIFPVARKNNFDVCSVIIDAAMNGKL